MLFGQHGALEDGAVVAGPYCRYSETVGRQARGAQRRPLMSIDHFYAVGHQRRNLGHSPPHAPKQLCTTHRRVAEAMVDREDLHSIDGPRECGIGVVLEAHDRYLVTLVSKAET